MRNLLVCIWSVRKVLITVGHYKSQVRALPGRDSRSLVQNAIEVGSVVAETYLAADIHFRSLHHAFTLLSVNNT